MKYLLHVALSKPKYIGLLILSICTALLFALAGPLEMFSLGVITKRGPDCFELFAPEVNGKLAPQNAITKDVVEKRFTEIDLAHGQTITKDDAALFVEQHGKRGVVDKGISMISRYFPFDKDIKLFIILLLFVALFKAVTLFAYRFSSRLFSIRVSLDLRLEYFEHLQTLPMSFYQEHHIGSLSTRAVSDAYTIADAINAMLVNYLQTPFTFLSTIIICFAVSWKLSLVVFFGLPVLIFPIIFLARRIRKISRQIQKRQESFAHVLIEFLSGIQTIKIFAMEEFSHKKYVENNEEMARLELKSSRYDLSSRPVLHTAGILCLIMVLLVGLYGMHLPLHEMLLFCGMLSVAYEPIKKFAEENSRIQRGITACDRMLEVLSLSPTIQDKENALSFTGLQSTIEFANVSFGYKQEPVLQNVSFTIQKGQKVAICGPTGAGKSTIALLLPRLWDVSGGDVLIDGKPITSYTQKSLRENIAFVPQKPFLFFDTVAENITFGRPYSEEQIRKAAILAHADEFITKLPNGYNTVLAETGKSLSGGQQQRIAIARALIKQASILVMDEATSSLDAMSEEHIKQALNSLKGKMTQIIIAHRLSTIEDADKIIYIEQGTKLAEGTKDELLRSCPSFKRMWELMHMQPQTE